MTDYTTALSVDIGLVLPQVVMLVAASLIMIFIASVRFQRLAPYIAIAAFAVAFGLSAAEWNYPSAGFAGMVTVDNFGVMFNLIFIAGSLLSLLLAFRFLHVKGLEKPEFYVLLLVSTLGMTVMANTCDLVVMFLGLEIMSVPLYVMAGLNRRSLESNEAGIKYFIMGAFATAFLLMGIAFIYGAAQTTDLRRLVADFNYIQDTYKVYLYAGVAFILVGFGFKIAAVPFHTWVPDVYTGAPTPITAFFSVGPKAAGFAVMLRIFTFGFGQLEIVSQVLWVIAVLTMSVGNILALRQDNVKRMLAYSSIAHAGYILVALTVRSSDAVSAAVFYLIAYTLFNLGAFAVLVALETRSGMKSEFTELSGMAKASPYLTAVLALFMFALAGFPPTIGFIGKFVVFSAAVKSGFLWLTVIGVLNSFVSVYYYLRVIKTTYFDQYDGQAVPATVSPALFVVLVVTAAGTLGLGLFPQQLLDLSRAAIFAFL